MQSKAKRHRPYTGEVPCGHKIHCEDSQALKQGPRETVGSLEVFEGSSPGQLDLKSLLTLLLLMGLGVESSQVLSNLNAPQVPLQRWDPVDCSHIFPRASLLAPKLWFLSHEHACAAVLGLGCHQLVISKGRLLLTFPSSVLARGHSHHSWSSSPLCLCLFSAPQGAWKEKRQLQSCWFLTRTLL